jgi:hypothetical protein
MGRASSSHPAEPPTTPPIKRDHAANGRRAGVSPAGRPRDAAASACFSAAKACRPAGRAGCAAAIKFQRPLHHCGQPPLPTLRARQEQKKNKFPENRENNREFFEILT